MWRGDCDVLEMWSRILLVVLVVPLVQPRQETRKENDFNKEFQKKFEEMDRQDRFYEVIDEGFDNWEERCLVIGGQAVLDKWLKAQEDLTYCIMQNFNFEEIHREMEIKKKTGDLDLIFDKYCGIPVSRSRPCLKNFLEISGECMKPEDKASLSVTMAMVDAAINFLCHEKGGRIALFLAGKGMECVSEHQEDMVNCINSTVPEIFHMNSQKRFDLIVFNNKNCRKGDMIRYCIEKELLKCPDTTPANIVESMLSAIRRATHCREVSKYPLLSSSDSRTTASTLAYSSILFLFTTLL